MMIPPKYFLTPQISKLLSAIEVNKEIINTITIPPEVERNIRRKSTLKSSLYSARIEGNPTALEEFSKLAARDQKKIEINNILRAINWIYEKSPKRKSSVSDICSLHKFVMKAIDYRELGKFRTKHEGIFSTAGVVIYHAPPPKLIKFLIERLLRYSNSERERFVPIRAVLSHYIFEKIHPFTDGSGRVGRLLMLMILKNQGYGFKGILPFEEKIDEKRETYYKMLEEPERDVTSYLEYMLQTLADASDEAKRAILDKKDFNIENTLLPRRAEIYQIIKDQKLINFDSIKRRFAQVNPRTLRYDLKKLADAGFIQKAGATRGVYYKTKE